MATDTHWLRVNPKDAPSFSVFTKQIQKSEQDDREYQIIRLENGLQATLIHDAKADKAAASLDVAVGHLHDPVRSCNWLRRKVSDNCRMICPALLIFVNIYYLW